MTLTKAELLERLNARNIRKVAEASPGQLLQVLVSSEKEMNILYKASLALIARRHNDTIIEDFGGYPTFARELALAGGLRHTWTIDQVARYMKTCAQSDYVNLKWKDTRLSGRHYPFVARLERDLGLA